MKLTKHATKRSQQRGIQYDVLLLISLFGEEIDKDIDGVKIQMTERALRKIIQILDKCKNKVIVTDKNFNKLITTYALYR